MLGLLQEDAHLIEPAVDNDNSVGVFAVFDGHGGKEVAAFAAIYMVTCTSDCLNSCFTGIIETVSHPVVTVGQSLMGSREVSATYSPWSIKALVRVAALTMRGPRSFFLALLHRR